MTTDITLDELKQALRDAMSGKSAPRHLGPRSQWMKDMEAADNKRRQEINAEVDAALGIDRTAPYIGHVAKARSKKKRRWSTRP